MTTTVQLILRSRRGCSRDEICEEAAFHLVELREMYAVCTLVSDKPMKRAKCRIRPGVRYRLERTWPANVPWSPNWVYNNVFENAPYCYHLRYCSPYQRLLRLDLDANDIVREQLRSLVQDVLSRDVASVVSQYIALGSGQKIKKNK